MFSTGWPPRKRLPQPRQVTGGWPSCCGAHSTDLRQPQAGHQHQDQQNAAMRSLAGQTRRRPGRPYPRGSERPMRARTGATEEGATSRALRGREVGWGPRGEARGCRGQANVICISRHIHPSTLSIDGGDQPCASLGGCRSSAWSADEAAASHSPRQASSNPSDVATGSGPGQLCTVPPVSTPPQQLDVTLSLNSG